MLKCVSMKDSSCAPSFSCQSSLDGNEIETRVLYLLAGGPAPFHTRRTFPTANTWERDQLRAWWPLWPHANPRAILRRNRPTRLGSLGDEDESSAQSARIHTFTYTAAVWTKMRPSRANRSEHNAISELENRYTRPSLSVHLRTTHARRDPMPSIVSRTFFAPIGVSYSSQTSFPPIYPPASISRRAFATSLIRQR